MSKLNRRSAILSVTSLALIPGMMAKSADSGSSGPYCADGRDASGAEKYVHVVSLKCRTGLCLI